MFEAAEMGDVERQQPSFTVCEHRRDDVCVVNLTTCDVVMAADLDEISRYSRIFI